MIVCHVKHGIECAHVQEFCCSTLTLILLNTFDSELSCISSIGSLALWHAGIYGLEPAVCVTAESKPSLLFYLSGVKSLLQHSHCKAFLCDQSL